MPDVGYSYVNVYEFFYSLLLLWWQYETKNTWILNGSELWVLTLMAL